MDTSPNAYLVEFATPPGHPLADQDATRFLESIKNFRSVHVRHRFRTLLNAVSMEISDKSELQQVQMMESLHSLTPLSIVTVPEHSQPSTNALVTNSLKLASVDRVHSELGLTGEGIKVGVIDTGIDYTHPALGGCFGKGCKVAFGWDFVGDDFTGTSTPKPSSDPRDCAGHGTHVAGTIAANGSIVKGVAPNAILGAYRVIGCNGSTTDDIIIAAMEKAVEDGMDVLNLSLGDANGWSPNPVGRAIARASERGVLVAAAQGNDGTVGLFSANYVGEGPNVLAVASIINTRISLPYFMTSLEPANKVLYSSPNGADQLFDKPESLTVLLNGTSPSQACDPLPESVQLKGKLVMVLRGTCFFKVKATNVLQRGAVGVIFINNAPGSMVASTEEVKATTGSVSQKDGMRLVDLLLKAGPTEQNGAISASATITFGEKPAIMMHPAGGSLSDFSSFGLDNHLRIKPDVAAPGENIYSTWMTNNGSYISLSGTSMASPHVAGSLALALQSLLKQGIPRTTLADKTWIRRVYNAFINSAIPARVFRNHVQADSGDMVFVDDASTDEPIPDESQAIESVAKQGAGLINVYKTILRLRTPPKAVGLEQPETSPFSYTQVLPVVLELNDTSPQQSSSNSATLTIHNQGNRAIQYEISHLPAEALNEPLIEPHKLDQTLYESPFTASTPLVKATRGDAKVGIPINTLTVHAGEQRRITVTIDPPPTLSEDKHWLYSGYIVIKPSAVGGATSQDDAIHIPYAGVKGSMKTLPIFLVNTPEHDILSNNQTQSCHALGALQAGKVFLIFSMENQDYPAISICLENPTRRLELDLLNATTLEVVGHIGAEENVARPPPTKPLKMVAWDGVIEPLNSTKSSRSILDGSRIHSANFVAQAKAQHIGPLPESAVSPSSMTKRDAPLLQGRSITSNSKDNTVSVSNGVYRFRVRVLRIFGDMNNDNDYETLIYPPFQIARP
ncbi:hypothetical protein BGZ73_006360 [Actinomortierella ambigua]|nr:hypothetical protein BGZ73_006360 [Actinomortierella ambigua]